MPCCCCCCWCVILQLPELLLAHYRVARSVNRVALEQRKSQVQARVQQLQTSVDSAQQRVQQLAETLQRLQRDMQHAAQQLQPALQRQQQVQQDRAGMQHGYRPENAPMALLTATFHLNAPPLGPRILLHPRAVGPTPDNPASSEVVHRELFQVDSPDWVRLHDAGDLLGPIVCLGSVERSDVARLLSALLHSDLKMHVVRSREASQRLRFRG